MHPIAQSAADTLADPASPFLLVVTFHVKPDQVDAFVQAMAEPRAETVKEAGNLSYALSRSAERPSEFLLYEHWTSVAALAAHLEEPHFLKFAAVMGDLLAEPPGLKFFVPEP